MQSNVNLEEDSMGALALSHWKKGVKKRVKQILPKAKVLTDKNNIRY